MKEYQRALNENAKKAYIFLNKLYSSIVVERSELSIDTINSTPTMIACSHRSHVDYALLVLELHRLGIQNIRTAAGDNLTKMPYLGKIWMKYGAFSVYRDRSSQRQVLSRLFEDTIQMIHGGDKVVVFPEGGRSYNGEMLQLRHGIIGAHIVAQYRKKEQQHLFLPVTVSYEIIPELHYFDIVRSGRKLRSHSNSLIKQIAGSTLYYGADLYAFAKYMAAPHLGLKYGTVYIDFGRPLVLGEMIDMHKMYQVSSSRIDFSALRPVFDQVCQELYKKLFRLYRILPLHVVSYILKNLGSSSTTDIMVRVEDVLNIVQKSERNCSSIKELSKQQLVEEGIRQLLLNKVITVKERYVTIKDKNLIIYFASTIKPE